MEEDNNFYAYDFSVYYCAEWNSKTLNMDVT